MAYPNTCTTVQEKEFKPDLSLKPGVPRVHNVTGDAIELHWAHPEGVNPLAIRHYNIRFNVGPTHHYYDTRTPHPQVQCCLA